MRGEQLAEELANRLAYSRTKWPPPWKRFARRTSRHRSRTPASGRTLVERDAALAKALAEKLNIDEAKVKAALDELDQSGKPPERQRSRNDWMRPSRRRDKPDPGRGGCCPEGGRQGSDPRRSLSRADYFALKTAASDAARLPRNTSSSMTGELSGPVNGTRQFGCSSIVPGWFWACRSPTASASERQQQPRRSASEIAMEGADGLLDVRALSHDASGAQVVEPGLPILFVRLQLLGQRSGENTQSSRNRTWSPAR